eukprot:2989185-Amphidinium_carterae.1
MISGRHAIVIPPCDPWHFDTDRVLKECCQKLGVSSTGSMCLVSGDGVVVPTAALVYAWPGLRARGEISEYQLVVQQS